MGFEAMQGAVMAGTLMLGALILGVIISLIKSIFSKGKSIVTKQIEENVKPFINDKLREHKENKILKEKNLFDNGIITEEEYHRRRKKIEEE